MGLDGTPQEIHHVVYHHTTMEWSGEVVFKLWEENLV